MPEVNIRARVLIPIYGVLITFLLITVAGVYWSYQRQIEKHIQEPIADLDTLFNTELDNDAKLLVGLITFIEDDFCVQNAWLSDNRNTLLSCTQSLFDEIKNKFQVTHFYFHTPDHNNFLRVHNPSKYGDHIGRFTLNKASLTQKMAYGIELSPNGTFTLRVVEPWFLNGKLMGYIELGEEIEHITPYLKKILDVDLIFMIDKQLLKREKWEEGLKILGKSGDWEMFSNYVVIDQTIPIDDSQLISFIRRYDMQEVLARSDLRIDGRSLRFDTTPLIDTAGNTVGQILIIKDISQEMAELSNFVSLLFFGTIIMGGLLFAYFWILLGNIQKRIETSIIKNQQANEKLRESEIRYRSIFNGINDAIFVENLSGEILDINDRACEMFGWSRTEFLTKTVRDIVPPENRALIPDELSEEDYSDEAFETVNIRSDGTRFPVAITGRVETISNEKRLLVVVRDISEQKKNELELIEAKEAAETATQVKAEFLANMSHEIRTPLNAIYGMTGLLLDTNLNTEQQDFVETIRGGGETLLSVINDILDFSKLEAGKVILEQEPFYLRECVETALDLVAEKASKKNLDLAYDIENNTPPVVIGDVTYLRQILVNLLSNAVKFTHKGEVVVSVKSKPIPGELHELFFSVRDTGIGIPKEKLDRLFKSFSQVDSSTTRKYGGTGLGLAISSQLTHVMGGKIWVESDEGNGSIFHFTIQVEVKSDAKPKTKQEIMPELAGKNILIVDDNATNRLILEKQTSSWGMKPITASSGAEALAKINECPTFDIGILDMQMPEMDGFTLAKEIEALCLENNFPIIILTSMGRTKTRKNDVPIAAFLNKPIKTSSLYNAIVDTLELRLFKETSAKSESQNEQKLGSRHPLRILLAEDNPTNQKVATHILKRIGYRADIANNGIEVLQALERQVYDVVLMDIQMPEMDGEQATKKIRADWAKDKQPHIIAMTAHALEGDREKYLLRGMDDYVSKPVKLEELIQSLEKVTRLED